MSEVRLIPEEAQLAWERGITAAGKRVGGSFFFAAKSVSLSKQAGRKPSTLSSAARHNLREIQAELGAHSHIDASRVHLNEVVAGPRSAQAVVQRAGELAHEAGVDLRRVRKDFCQAVEFVFSLPADTNVDTGMYFRRCVHWTIERFGEAAVLSAVVHYDEPSPHAHVLVSPIVGGRMRGSELIAKAPLAALRKSFEASVGRPFNLAPPPPRLTGAVRRRATAAVLEKLERTRDGVTRSAAWSTFKSVIEADPRPFMAALDVDVEPAPARRMRTSVQIFTSPGRGPKVERDVRRPVARYVAGLASVSEHANRPKPILCRLSSIGSPTSHVEGWQR